MCEDDGIPKLSNGDERQKLLPANGNNFEYYMLMQDLGGV